jgi:heme/copper-type cytochrome/quinol oxidase subunit 3
MSEIIQLLSGDGSAECMTCKTSPELTRIMVITSITLLTAAILLTGARYAAMKPGARACYRVLGAAAAFLGAFIGAQGAVGARCQDSASWTVGADASATVSLVALVVVLAV